MSRQLNICMFSAKKQRKQKRKFVRKLEKVDVKQQLQVEKRWLATMLGDKKAVALVLEYLKIIDIRKRKKVRERELKWERKNNQASKNLFQ